MKSIGTFATMMVAAYAQNARYWGGKTLDFFPDATVVPSEN